MATHPFRLVVPSMPAFDARAFAALVFGWSSNVELLRAWASIGDAPITITATTRDTAQLLTALPSINAGSPQTYELTAALPSVTPPASNTVTLAIFENGTWLADIATLGAGEAPMNGTLLRLFTSAEPATWSLRAYVSGGSATIGAGSPSGPANTGLLLCKVVNG